jgi:hypothetical protein
MISKGKRRNLVSTYACLDFIRKIGLPNKGIDVFALCARGSRLLHVRKPVKPEPFDYDKFLETAVGSSESWETAGKMATAICGEALRHQEQQVVRKPRVTVVKCVDWSNTDLPLDVMLPSFVEKGPL